MLVLAQPAKIAIATVAHHVSPLQPYNQHWPPYSPKRPQLDLGCKLTPLEGAGVVGPNSGYFGCQTWSAHVVC